MVESKEVLSLPACETANVLLDALDWFEEHIGHDGAPDGGDPSWVGSAAEIVAKVHGVTYRPDIWPVVHSVMRKRRSLHKSDT